MITPPEDCMKTIRGLFDEASEYNAAIPRADFRTVEDCYYKSEGGVPDS
jgi:hypothetical protein